jgi:hypothetical protein
MLLGEWIGYVKLENLNALNCWEIVDTHQGLLIVVMQLIEQH